MRDSRRSTEAGAVVGRGIWAILVSPVLAILFATSAIAGDGGKEKGGFPSNLALLERLTRGAAASVADSLELREGAPVTILSTTWHEANWFVANLVAETLANRGHPVQVLEVATPPREGEETGGSTGRPGSGAPGGNGGRQPGAPGLPTGGGQVGGGAGDASGGSGGIGDEAGIGGALGDTTGVAPDSADVESDPLWGESEEEEEGEGEGEPGTATATPPQVSAQRSVLPGPGSATGMIPFGDVLDVRVVEFGVQYADASRTLLFGPLRFTRIGGVYLQVGHLRGPQGEVLRMVSAERHDVDRLSGSDRILAEGASYPFTPPSLNQPSLGKYIEPAVVVAIVGSLVYLFYSNQN